MRFRGPVTSPPSLPPPSPLLSSLPPSSPLSVILLLLAPSILPGSFKDRDWITSEDTAQPWHDKLIHAQSADLHLFFSTCASFFLICFFKGFTRFFLKAPRVCNCDAETFLGAPSMYQYITRVCGGGWEEGWWGWGQNGHSAL